jgi:hypothetical protein
VKWSRLFTSDSEGHERRLPVSDQMSLRISNAALKKTVRNSREMLTYHEHTEIFQSYFLHRGRQNSANDDDPGRLSKFRHRYFKGDDTFRASRVLFGAMTGAILATQFLQKNWSMPTNFSRIQTSMSDDIQKYTIADDYDPDGDMSPNADPTTEHRAYLRNVRGGTICAGLAG